MKSAVIFLFCLTYFHGDKINASSLNMLQIDVLNTENIVSRTNSSIVYQFTNNEKLIATCRRKEAGGKIRLTWYKSGLVLNTTTEDKLEQTLILNEIDSDTTLECRLRVEDSRNKDYHYQEGKSVLLKYTTSAMKKYVHSSVDPKTEEPPLPPPPPRLGTNNTNNNNGNGDKEDDNKENGNKENDNNVYVYVSITLAIILVILLLIFIMRKIYKKLKVSKENVLKTTAEPTINARYSCSKDAYEDSGFQETYVYSVPYNQAEIFSGSIPPVEAHKILDTSDYSNLINNNYYYQNKKNNQNLYYNVN